MVPACPWLFLAVEDSDFYNHPGIDLKAIARAFINNWRRGGIGEGGSTITQQVGQTPHAYPGKKL